MRSQNNRSGTFPTSDYPQPVVAGSCPDSDGGTVMEHFTGKEKLYADLSRRFSPISQYIQDEHAKAALDSLLWDLAGEMAQGEQ
jgi:hypothetical protein